MENDQQELVRNRWEQQDASYQGMMLNTRAGELHHQDTSEILSFLPTIKGMDVVEFGAGIGRLTGHLAERAKHVLAVDFVEKFIEKNKELNSIYKNIEYVVDNVLNLKLKQNSTGFIFTNWLFMYLDDEATTRLLSNMLEWLPSDGYVFIRESCIHGSGDLSFEDSTTYYRKPMQYEEIFRSVSFPTDDRKTVYGFRIVMSKTMNSYREMFNNSNQVAWLLQKTGKDSSQGLQ